MAVKILITGAGGPAAICAYKALKDKGYDFFMADMDPLATGLYFVEPAKRFVIPGGVKPEFNQAILRLCEEQQIDILIPTVDVELIPLMRIKGAFDAIGCRMVSCSEDVLYTILDKLRLMEKCSGIVLLPEFQSLEEYLINPQISSKKLVFKPRSGSGSRGIIITSSPERNVLEKLKMENYMVQEFIGGTEYSIDLMLNEDGSVAAAVVRERLKIDSGVVIASRTIKNKRIQDYCIKIAQAVGVTYGVNIQVIVDDSGNPYLLEINPRFSGGLSLVVESGPNIPAMCVEHALSGKPIPYVDYKELAMVRYYEEIYMSGSELIKHNKVSSTEEA
ncbi:carbamoyl-phosphate synthase large subunit [Dysgonomonas alginatilytica]|uniref:Carbamoyl-phosphate synthase large subunit n=1 Tax=Dysgonomonas alginatilytica TaxID=1605892 RepID=A0A2V3PIS3_9BACT|nr:ATP-grasp domain-containing protein [Dysgonomonas alginatilytica]PXV60019.1 carbamoyl-phosphate synthase large subunit [Dysgonomonas alginatilytica]